MSTWRPTGGSGTGPDGRGDDGSDPHRVSHSLPRVTKALGGAEPAVLGAVFAHWEEAVGAGIADHAAPVSLRGGVLVVAVSEPAWATQLRFLEREVLERLEQAAGTPVADRIEVRVRPVGGGRRGRGSARGDTPDW